MTVGDFASSVNPHFNSFCNNCKIFAILSFDSLSVNPVDFQIDTSINNFYYSLTNGACSASYVPTEESW